VKQNDPAAPRRVVRSEEYVAQAMRTWGPHVWRLALAQAPTRVDAEEVYQDAFLRLATEPADFESGEHLKAWLLRVTVNLCRDRLRRLARRPTESFDGRAYALSDPACEADPVERREESALVLAAVGALPPKLRVVVHLHYGEELGCDCIAQILGVRPSTVRVRLKRARDKLRQSLAGYFDPNAPTARKADNHEPAQPIPPRRRGTGPAHLPR